MTISPEQARLALEGLLARCTLENSSPMFRTAIEDAIIAIDRDDLKEAARIIGDTTAHVADLHVCVDHARDFEPHPLQASEDETEAYIILDRLRHGFGWAYVRVPPSNSGFLS